MQQEAGLRQKCLGGRLACGRLPISLVYRATEWSCNPTSTYSMIYSSIQLLLTRKPTIGPSYYFINPSLLKLELFSAINKSIRPWAKQIKGFQHIHVTSPT